MILGTIGWLLPVSLIITSLFGGVLVLFAGCWWLIFRRTIQRFNTKGPTDDH